MSRVLITGGLGFLGQRMCRALLRQFELRQQAALEAGAGLALPHPEIILFDASTATASAASAATAAPRPLPPVAMLHGVSVVRGGVEDGATLASVVADFQPTSIFHLASVMSGEGERDMDKAIRVNLDGTRHLLQACRDLHSQAQFLPAGGGGGGASGGGGRGGAVPPRVVFSSSIAVYGGQQVVGPTSSLLPTTTYGATKACAELLLADYTRRGFIDGRTVRLPTVIVRPGPPNPAATGVYSSLPKAVLNGQQDFVSPVPASLHHPVTSVGAAVQGLLDVHERPVGGIGGGQLKGRQPFNLPALSVTLGELLKASTAAATSLGRRPGKVSFEPSDETTQVVRAMPCAVEGAMCPLGGSVTVDPLTVEAIIDEYVREHCQEGGKD